MMDELQMNTAERSEAGGGPMRPPTCADGRSGAGSPSPQQSASKLFWLGLPAPLY